jgi:hypothetical protein
MQKLHAPPVLLRNILIIALVFLMVSICSPFTAQDEAASAAGQSEEFEPHALESAASCANVAYGTSATSAVHHNSEDIEHFAVPPNPSGPTLVDLGLFIEAITDIDPVTNTFRIEGFIDLVWCDAREAFNPDELGWHEKIFLEDNAQEELNSIWQPDITFPNESGPRETENLEVIVYENGTIEYEERFSVTLEAHFDLSHFPFDSQLLEVEIESLAWSEQYLMFHREADMIGFSDNFELAEWHSTGVETEIREVREIRDRHPYSEFVMLIRVERLSGFYIWRLFMPMIVIVALSWSVFWMHPEDLSNRLMVSFTGILTVVAYQFTISSSLPRIPYMTFMDTVITFSFFMMALTIVENLLVFIFQSNDDERDDKLSHNIEVASRFVFPIIFVAGLVFAAFYFGVF